MSAIPDLPWCVERSSGVRIVYGEPDEWGIRSDVPGIGRVGRLGNAAAAELAEFIVRACNAHEELLGALKKVESYMGAMGKVEIGTRLGFGFTAKEIAAAIAKAEGK